MRTKVPYPFKQTSNDSNLSAGLWELLRRNKIFITKYREHRVLYHAEHREYLKSMSQGAKELYDEAYDIYLTKGPKAYTEWHDSMSDDIYYKHWRDIRNKCPNIYFGKNREEQDSLFSRNPISLMICEALCENLPEASLPDYLFSRSFYEGNFFEKSFHQLPEEIRNGIIQHRKEDIFEMKLCDIDETNGCEPLYWKFAVSVPLGGATPEDIQKVVKAFEAELRAKTTGRTDSKRYMLESIIGSPEAWDALLAYEQAKDHYADKLEQMDSDTRVEKLDRYAWDQSRFQGQEPRRFSMLKEQRDKIMNETSEEGLVYDIYPDLKLGGYKHAP